MGYFNPIFIFGVKRFLKEATHFSCLLDALADCQRIVATCGRIDHGEIPLCQADEAMKWLLKASSNTSGKQPS